ncbi:pimeloyl-ACP methyl ester carboxylesterase [Phycicoccus badiiscoriae]|uniref:Pimeloyl-ACP methyl ester carboxylesterase n=1 Tax=Pedococcus badiiscoriae TaxID=642776 RepID=A0A852WER8_9MICO|nr:alpha/beta hydrolase [Pedococcus badiiscoriae]NYG07727.1 pimeloyl-ACP methyl ester carboxylesterase [Pedococcus badiiscoriae]
MPTALDAADLAYRWSGPADPGSPTIVLLHGLGDSGDCWPDAVRRWSPDYRVVGVDLLGHGRSPRFTPEQRASPDPMEHMYAAALATVEQVAAVGGPVALVAHSMGGGIATALTARHPDLVRAAVLEEPAWRDPELRVQSPTVVAERIADCRAFSEDLEGQLAQGRADNPTWPESEFAPWAQAKTEVDLDFLALGVASFARPWEELVGAIEVPTLVVVGERSTLLPEPIRLRAKAIDNPHVRIELLAADHCVRRDVPDAFHALVDPWLADQF